MQMLLGDEPALLSGLRVLVVDDNLDSRDLLKFVLEQEGAEVATASCVEEAIEQVEQLKPDLLLSELKLPQEDGYKLIEQIRALSQQELNPVVAIATTVCAKEEDRIHAAEAGFQAHLAKPIDLDELISLVLGLTVAGSGRSSQAGAVSAAG